MKRTNDRGTLVIASHGLEPRHITLETLAELRKCDIVFSQCLDGKEADFIIEACRSHRTLRGLGPEKAAGKVLASFSAHRTVGFVTYGNPYFLNAGADMLRTMAAKAGVTVRVLPAVSSFDSIVNLLNLNNFAQAGLRLLDCASIALGGARPDPEMDTLLFLPANLNKAELRPARRHFFSSLASSYPGRHPAIFISLPCIGDKKGKFLRSTIAGMSKVFRQAGHTTTVFIPALKKNGL